MARPSCRRQGRWRPVELRHPGVGTIGHLGTELLKARSGINPVHVPYNGYPQVATAMLGKQLQMALLPPALAQSQAQAGKLRLIGVTSGGRSPLAPDVPSLAEVGVPDFDLQIWNAFAAPTHARGHPRQAGQHADRDCTHP